MALPSAAPGAGEAPVQRTWIGVASSLWNTPENWNPTGAPQPGDTVYTGSEDTTTITLSGASASVAQIIGDAKLVIDGATLTITGAPSIISILADVDVVGGGAIAVTGTASVATGDVRLGETVAPASTGSVSISAAATLSGTIREIGAGNGSLTVTPPEA